MEDIKQFAKKDFYNFLSPYGLGDTIMLCALSRNWESANNGKIHFIIKPSHEIIMKMYNISNYSLCQFKNTYYKKEFFELAKKEPIPKKGHIFIAHPLFHKWSEEIVKNFEKNDTKTYFENMYKQFLNLPINSKLYLPQKEFLSSKSIKKIKNIENTILLIPESHSIHPFKHFFWKVLIKIIKKDGILIQNTINPKHEIKGLPNIDLTLEEIIILSTRAKAVYAIRSGICDLIAPFAKNLITFYPAQNNLKEKYSLNRIFNTNIKEITSNSEDVCLKLFGIIPIIKYQHVTLDIQKEYFNITKINILVFNLPFISIKIKPHRSTINLFNILPIFKIKR